MGKRVFFAISVLLILVVALATSLFIEEYLNDTDEYEFLVISCLLGILTVILIVSFVLDFIVGHKDYIFEKDEIIVGRNGKVLYKIAKKDISDPVFTYDAGNKELCCLSFKSGNKKHRFILKKNSVRSAEIFFRDIGVIKNENTAVYIIQMILDIFSI